MVQGYHQKTISLEKPIKGQLIINAMIKLAKETYSMDNLEYRVEINRGEPRTLKVGFYSPYPFNQVVILTGKKLDRTELNPEATYKRIAIGTEDWRGMIYGIGYNQESVEKAVNKIASYLGKALEARL